MTTSMIEPVGRFLAGALDLGDDEQSWVPQADGVWFKPLLLSATQGYYVNLLRVSRAGVLAPSSRRSRACLHLARPLAVSGTRVDSGAR